MIVTEREREAETQAEGEAGSMHREPDVGFDPGSPRSRPGPKTGAKPLATQGSLFHIILVELGALSTAATVPFYSRGN